MKDIWNLKMKHNTQVKHLEFYLVHSQLTHLKQSKTFFQKLSTWWHPTCSKCQFIHTHVMPLGNIKTEMNKIEVTKIRVTIKGELFPKHRLQDPTPLLEIGHIFDSQLPTVKAKNLKQVSKFTLDITCKQPSFSAVHFTQNSDLNYIATGATH